MRRDMFRRIPRHIGVIPDGNRRWAQAHGLEKEEGYRHGIAPGYELYKLCVELGIEEMSFYGFTHDNTKRPAIQRQAFQTACVEAVEIISDNDADLLVVGNYTSKLFPRELLPYTTRQRLGQGLIRLNFLVNYDWQWDLLQVTRSAGWNEDVSRRDMLRSVASSDVSRIDLIIRWGGRRRLSGFLPVQTIYSDFYVIDDYWPDFRPEHLYEALKWYEQQDVTLGG
jgi:undecaprenyl diphosphate synthase